MPNLPIQHIEQDLLGKHLNEKNSSIQWTDSISFPEPPEYDDLNDARVLRYLFRNFTPKRHLEFGTWKGKGVRRVLEESAASSVWTINLWEGEYNQAGGWAYPEKRKTVTVPDAVIERDGKTVRTDAGGMIGIEYLRAGLGCRVNQIYSDSRLWDDLAYPDGFFDSAFVDGAHDAATSRADMYKALRLLRPGGLLLVHDFCPLKEVNAQFSSTVGVTGMIADELENIAVMCDDFFWIEDTWLFCGIRGEKKTGERALLETKLIQDAREIGRQQALAEIAHPDKMKEKRLDSDGKWKTYGQIMQQRDKLLRSRWMKLGISLGFVKTEKMHQIGAEETASQNSDDARESYGEIMRQRDVLLRSRWRKLGLMLGVTRKF